MIYPLPSPCSDPVIALRAIVLGADGLGWIGRWLVLVLGRLEGLLLALRSGVLVVAPVQLVGAGGSGGGMDARSAIVIIALVRMVYTYLTRVI